MPATEREIDFKKLMLAFKSKRYSNSQLGSLTRQYFSKHKLDDFNNFIRSDEPAYPELEKNIEPVEDILAIFDGGLFTQKIS